MPRARFQRPLSELEGCVLGELLKRGASTPYAIRRVFLDSPSSHWSGSAGSVYPVLQRLERLGLVRSRSTPRGGRSARSFELTGAGRRHFQRWLEPPFERACVSVPPDPLRTRLSFLSCLPAQRRRRFLTEAVKAMQRELAALEDLDEPEEDECPVRSAAVHAMRARLEHFGGLRRAPRKP